MTATFTVDVHDWDFLVGRWTVRHRRLKARLAGSTEWDEFDGTCLNWPTLGGQGNVDDNVLELPGGAYRALGIRALNAKEGYWMIWWLDQRYLTIDAPMRGGFKDGVGTFLADETFNGRPIQVRFRWSEITATSARWGTSLLTERRRHLGDQLDHALHARGRVIGRKGTR